MFFWILGCAKQAPIGVPVSAARPSLVYEVEKDGRISHLFGTCHLPIALEDRVDPTLIEQAREVWVEARIDQTDPMEMMGMMWRDAPLSDELGRELFTTLTRRTGISAPASMANHLEPWSLAAILGMGELVDAEDLNEPALDQQVMDRAKEAGVPIHTVETLQEQVEALRGEVTELDEMLRPTDDDLVAQDEAGQVILELCERNDLQRVPAQVYLDGTEAMLRDRNHRWIPRLLPSLDQGGAFVAVGALHLPGPDGLIDLLTAEGFTVRNLPRPSRPRAVPSYRAPRLDPPQLMPLEQRDLVASEVAKELCAEDQIARSCFLPDVDACTERVTLDMQLCIDASFSSIEALQQMDPNDVLFNACALTGLIAQSMAFGWPERPACAPFQAAMAAKAERRHGGTGPADP